MPTAVSGRHPSPIIPFERHTLRHVIGLERTWLELVQATTAGRKATFWPSSLHVACSAVTMQHCRLSRLFNRLIGEAPEPNRVLRMETAQLRATLWSRTVREVGLGKLQIIWLFCRRRGLQYIRRILTTFSVSRSTGTRRIFLPTLFEAVIMSTLLTELPNDGTRGPRLEIDEFIGDNEVTNLFLLALAELQANPVAQVDGKANWTNFYGIAGEIKLAQSNDVTSN